MVMEVCGGGEGGGGDVAVGGDAEADGLGAACGGQVGLGEFAVRGGEADAESFGFAGPAFAFGFGDAGQEVVADPFEAVALGGVDSQEGASDECSWMQLVEYARPQSPSQLRDSLAYARQNNLVFNLYVRASTRLSGPLEGLVNSGDINRIDILP